METLTFSDDKDAMIYYTKTDDGCFKAILKGKDDTYDVTHFSIGQINKLIKGMTGNDQSRLHLQGERIKRKTPKQVRITPSITVIKRKRA